MATTITDYAEWRLLQLASATLPVGGYAFSQGMEAAVHAGWLPNKATTSHWLRDQLSQNLTHVDVPLLNRIHEATLNSDTASLADLNDWLLACRETTELRLTDTAMGEALARLLDNLGHPPPDFHGQPGFASVFGWAGATWGLDAATTCRGYLWSWLENQVAAAAKLVPLGQSACQELLSELLPDLEAASIHGRSLDEEAIGASLPALALVSCQHESQYSRLFRS